MILGRFRVLLDANVLYPFTLRDTLLRAAHAGYFQVYWSAEILEEATRNLVLNGVVSAEGAERLRNALANAFPEAAVSGYEGLVEAMTNERKDRHVVAAAVKAGAQVIVTVNLPDFRALPEGVEAQSPDEFLTNLFDLDPSGLLRIVQEQARDLRRPPRTFDEVVSTLGKIAPHFAERLRPIAGTR